MTLYQYLLPILWGKREGDGGTHLIVLRCNVSRLKYVSTRNTEMYFIKVQGKYYFVYQKQAKKKKKKNVWSLLCILNLDICVG